MSAQRAVRVKWDPHLLAGGRRFRGRCADASAHITRQVWADSRDIEM
jgi:hypothetical protein